MPMPIGIYINEEMDLIYNVSEWVSEWVCQVPKKQEINHEHEYEHEHDHQQHQQSKKINPCYNRQKINPF